MSYQVLARKWRPRDFAAMVGQNHVLRTLENALNKQRLHHAYLLTGTRGVGKTTLARILAKCFNCETGITATPCGQCSACEAIDQGRFLDLLEVDAASRTKVEDTRELLDNVQYAPTRGRYKIYLIDEVHMLSTHSFNALLKTLEEPPEHVKFLLATTDPQRLPITVRSRCLQFNLQKIPASQISEHLANILQQESITFEKPALDMLSQAADGSLRDALSLLDQAIAFSNHALDAPSIATMLGHTEQTLLFALLESLATQDASALMQNIEQISMHALDFSQVLDQLLTLLHQMALAQQIDDYAAHAQLLEIGQQLSANDVQLYYQIALIGKRDLALAPTPRSGFEMIMLRMLAFQRHDNVVATPSPRPVTQATPKPKANVTTAPKPKAKVTTTPPPVAPSNDKASWTEILRQLSLSGITQTIAENCSLQQVDKEQIILCLDNKQHALLNDKHQQRLAEALTQYFKRPLRLTINVSDAPNTPAKQIRNQQEKSLANARTIIENDAHVQNLQKTFDARINEDSYSCS